MNSKRVKIDLNNKKLETPSTESSPQGKISQDFLAFHLKNRNKNHFHVPTVNTKLYDDESYSNISGADSTAIGHNLIEMSDKSTSLHRYKRSISSATQCSRITSLNEARSLTRKDSSKSIKSSLDNTEILNIQLQRIKDIKVSLNKTENSNNNSKNDVYYAETSPNINVENKPIKNFIFKQNTITNKLFLARVQAKLNLSKSRSEEIS